ncbi:hypothetical protein Tdes44962_MAKER10233, partial [Teratosphaeria destructans]
PLAAAFERDGPGYAGQLGKPGPAAASCSSTRRTRVRGFDREVWGLRAYRRRRPPRRLYLAPGTRSRAPRHPRLRHDGSTGRRVREWLLSRLRTLHRCAETGDPTGEAVEVGGGEGSEGEGGGGGLGLWGMGAVEMDGGSLHHQVTIVSDWKEAISLFKTSSILTQV